MRLKLKVRNRPQQKSIIRSAIPSVHTRGRYIVKEARFPFLRNSNRSPQEPASHTLPTNHPVESSDSTTNSTSPFALDTGRRPVIQLWMLFVSMMVFAGIALLLALLARVPAVSNSLSILLGTPAAPKSDKPDRSVHLFMLLFCYASPILMIFWVSMLRSFLLFQQKRLEERQRQQEYDDREFSMER